MTPTGRAARGARSPRAQAGSTSGSGGSFGRGVKVYVDGRYVGRALRCRPPSRWRGSARDAGAGPHRVESSAPAATSNPATARTRPTTPSSLRRCASGSSRSRRPSPVAVRPPLDWVEPAAGARAAATPTGAPTPAADCPTPGEADGEQILLGPRPGRSTRSTRSTRTSCGAAQVLPLLQRQQRERTEVGEWRTGFAVGSSPNGPFRWIRTPRHRSSTGARSWPGERFVQGYDRRDQRVPARAQPRRPPLAGVRVASGRRRGAGTTILRTSRSTLSRAASARTSPVGPARGGATSARPTTEADAGRAEEGVDAHAGRLGRRRPRGAVGVRAGGHRTCSTEASRRRGAAPDRRRGPDSERAADLRRTAPDRGG